MNYVIELPMYSQNNFFLMQAKEKKITPARACKKINHTIALPCLYFLPSTKSTLVIYFFIVHSLFLFSLSTICPLIMQEEHLLIMHFPWKN